MKLGSPDRRDTTGQILAIFAGGFIGLVILVGLVIDGGFAFVNRREAQNIADTAALSGTKAIADSYTEATKLSNQIYDVIEDNVVNGNGCSPTDATACTWEGQYVDRNEAELGAVADSASSLPAGTQGGHVTVTRNPRTFFFGVFGVNDWDISAAATAITAKIQGLPLGQLLPIATNPPQPFQPGYEYTLTEVAGGNGQGQSPEFGPGNFGWLAWFDTNDPNALAYSLCNPNNPEFALPHSFPGDPGASNSGDVRACLDMWIASGTPVLIPIVSGCDPCNGEHASFTIIGIATFILTSYDGQGPAINSITGRFVENFVLPPSGLVPGGLGGAPSPTDTSFYLGLIR